MEHNFWDKLPRPFFVLAPMADVTDYAYRQIIARRGKPDVFFTEFVAADGLVHKVGQERLLIDLKYSENERPIVAQIWGGRPANIEEASKIVADLGFDGIDINMGCPDKGVERQLGGAGLIRNYDLAKKVIQAALIGGGGLPVSVKTRLGYNSIDLDWLGMLGGTGISALTVHLRTRKEMSRVPAHWELAGTVKELAKNFSASSTPLLVGNGDVESLTDAQNKARASGLDGVMLGRAIFGNPWLFANSGKPSWPEVFETMIEHSDFFQKTYIDEPMALGKKPYKNFALMRKFFGSYVSGHEQATKIKSELMECESAKEVEKVLRLYK